MSCEYQLQYLPCDHCQLMKEPETIGYTNVGVPFEYVEGFDLVKVKDKLRPGNCRIVDEYGKILTFNEFATLQDKRTKAVELPERNLLCGHPDKALGKVNPDDPKWQEPSVGECVSHGPKVKNWNSNHSYQLGEWVDDYGTVYRATTYVPPNTRPSDERCAGYWERLGNRREAAEIIGVESINVVPEVTEMGTLPNRVTELELALRAVREALRDL